MDLAHLGLDRFGQDVAASNDLAATLIGSQTSAHQLGHDLGRDWDNAWHTVFESERSDEVNREHDRLADQAPAASVERAGALDAGLRSGP
jgi:hypothetical protein